MKYRLEIGGYGYEVYTKSISEKFYNFIQNEYDGDFYHYYCDLNNDKIKDEDMMILNPYELYWNDIADRELIHPLYNSSKVTVYDENEEIIINNKDSEDFMDYDEEYIEAVEKGKSAVVYMENIKSSCLYTVEIETDEAFDSKKLSFELIYFNCGGTLYSFIGNISYEGKILEYSCDDYEHKGSEYYLIGKDGEIKLS